jgi:hypothetical protein
MNTHDFFLLDDVWLASNQYDMLRKTEIMIKFLYAFKIYDTTRYSIKASWCVICVLLLTVELVAKCL